MSLKEFRLQYKAEIKRFKNVQNPQAKRFSKEFREDAINLIKSEQATLQSVSEVAFVSTTTLHKWVKGYSRKKKGKAKAKATTQVPAVGKEVISASSDGANAVLAQLKKKDTKDTKDTTVSEAVTSAPVTVSKNQQVINGLYPVELPSGIKVICHSLQDVVSLVKELDS